MDRLTVADNEYSKTLSLDERQADAETWAAPVFNGFDAARKSFDTFLMKMQQKVENDDEIIQPCDSASQVSVRSYASSRSTSSSAVSKARAEAVAKKAELLARASALKKKRALEEKFSKLKQQQREQEANRRMEEIKRQEEEDCLRRQQEDLDMETELAVNGARIQALDEIENVGSAIEQLDIKSNYEYQQEDEQLSPTIRTNLEAQSTFNPYADQFTPLPSTTLPEMKPPMQAPVFSSPWQQPVNFSPDVMEIMKQQSILIKQQSDMANVFRTTQQKALLPHRKITPFAGDPLDYSSWLLAFNHAVEEECSSARDKLFYLEQFTAGEVNKVVKGYMRKDPEEGYKEAKETIAARYGNKYKVASAYLKKAQEYQDVKSGDATALNDYSLFLLECQNTMEGLDYMSELNHTTNIQMLVRKMPFKLRERWRGLTTDIQERRMVTFYDLVSFVTKQSRIANNPVYGEINEGRSQERDRSTTFKPRQRHARSFTTETTKFTGDVNTSGCLYCEHTSHKLEACRKLYAKPPEERIKFLQTKGLCFGCLKRASHVVKDCTNRLKCKHCHRNHATLLHYDKPQNNKSAPPVDKARQDLKETSNEDKVTCGSTGAGCDDSSPEVVPVLVRSKDNARIIKTYAFLDNGSDAVFCTDSLQKQLHIKGKRTNLQVKTLTGEKLVQSNIVSGLQISDLEGKLWLDLPAADTQDKVPASVADAISNKDIKNWSYLDDVTLPEVDSTGMHVGLLIGNNVPAVMEPLQVINSVGNGPFACKTRIGWVVCGVKKQKGSPNRSVSVNRITTKESSLEDQLTLMYNQDFNERLIHDKPERSQEDQMFMDLMATSIKKTKGHYQLPLPFRDRDVKFPNNRVMAEYRLAHLKRKFSRQPDFKDEYTKTVKKTIEKGYAEAAPHDAPVDKTWYIPHHGVYHPRKGKLRVVFDCAATYKGVSLNKQLLQGPDLTNSLFGVLIRFRQHSTALMADIEAMFNQVKVPHQDRDTLRFLWWPDGDVNKPVEEYRMTTHLFGATSSPSCVNYALKRTSQDNASKYTKVATDTIQHNFYVDDCLKSVCTEDVAVSLARDLAAVCKEGGFHLTKWTSNSSKVMRSIPKEERADEGKQMSLDYGDNTVTERALGLLWSVSEDKFKFNINFKGQPATRRGILSSVSSIYDPLGMVSPAILPAKMILQDLCRGKIGWDDEIPSQQAKQWNTWLNTIHELSDFSINRCLKPLNWNDDYEAQIHHFSDASEKGYGTASYLRLSNTKGDVHSALLMSKARVAPLKKISIPRMELTAATVAVRVNHMVHKELEIPIQHTYYWTDSTTVLNYINNKTARFHTFVANRLAVIHDGSMSSQWRYVPTALNPADYCSRGQSVRRFLENHSWSNGTEFLWQDETRWPSRPMNLRTELNDDPEVKEVVENIIEVKEEDEEERSQVEEEGDEEESEDVSVNVLKVDGSDCEYKIDKLFQHYSSWYKLKRAVAWILRVKKGLHSRVTQRQTSSVIQPPRKDQSCLTTDDIRDAERAIVRYVQQTVFPEEIAMLKGTPSEKQHLKRSSPTHRLDPKLDGDGILRVGGRLGRSAMPEEVKHPYILPKNHLVTRLILEDIHTAKGHVGRSYMLAQFRLKFWASGANSTSRSIISKCVTCRRQYGKVQHQKMADLPADRLTPNEPPFTRVGMDYFGPFYVKVGRSEVKRYGVIFTCLAIRAIHIEKADALDTNACLNAIRRFIARRGQVQMIRSDNGTNLVGAQAELRKGIKEINQAKIQGELLQRNVTWTFSPPAGSHHGGVWERQIRSVRKVLGSIMKQQTLTDDYLQTLFCEVEAIVNSRPITTVAEDPGDLEALTPNHLLLMKVQPVLPPAITAKTDMYARRRWKHVQYLADLFWHRWTKEYLPQLQQRQKWVQPKRNVRIGDIVVIVDDTVPRNIWQMGRVIEVMPDKNGFVRRVRLQTKTSTLVRPISKLIMLLECDDATNVSDSH